jgi:hypothetical protein
MKKVKPAAEAEVGGLAERIHVDKITARFMPSSS